MYYGPKTQAFFEKNKQLQKDNPLVNIDPNLSLQQIVDVIDVAELRKNTALFFEYISNVPLPETMTVTRIDLVKAKLLMFTPNNIRFPAPVIIYNTAGGFVLDMAEEQKSLCSKMALAANAIVISITTGLAPENKLPKIVDDAYETVKTIYQHSADYQIDPENFFLSGYSAGAKLSYLMALRAVNDPDVHIKAMALISGNYDLSHECAMQPEDIAAREKDFMATAGSLNFFTSQYIASFDTDLKDPLHSPFYADATGLPPTTIIAGDCDVFMGENKALAKKLIDTGVKTDLIINSGHIHNTAFMFDTDLGDGEDPAIQAGCAIKNYILT